MAMKSNQSVENTQKAMAGSTKRQIASRLRRAGVYAVNLVSILAQTAVKASTKDELEARAYLAMMSGSLNFERRRWQDCLHNYAVARIVYVVLGLSGKSDLFRDLLSGIVDPSIRYASYQLKIPRTKPVHDLAVENFPPMEHELRQMLLGLDDQAFPDSSKQAASAKAGKGATPTTISWRARTVKSEEAAISQALSIASEYEKSLGTKFDEFQASKIDSREFALAYDDIINARQDAVDATKAAIDDLNAEGVQSGDPRIQALQISRTALSYAVIEWRIGRNRILCGKLDGLQFDLEKPTASVKQRKDDKVRSQREEKVGHKLARLRERAALYEAILQSIDGIKELPGVIADTALMQELSIKRNHFRSLR